MDWGRSAAAFEGGRARWRKERGKRKQETVVLTPARGKGREIYGTIVPWSKGGVAIIEKGKKSPREG